MKSNLFKISLFAFSVALIGASCSPKVTEPIIEEVVEESPMPSGDIASGKNIFDTNCMKCHDLPIVDMHTPEQWAKILPPMMNNSKLVAADQALVRAYVDWELAN